MRLVDALLRQGHLSERAIVEALMTGDRPLHLDRCDVCAARAVEMNRWLDAVKSAAVDAADEAFPQERLAAQQAQIQRRLAQLDEPARVIAFPGQPRYDARDAGRRRVAPAWLGVAAAAGLVVGVIGGQAMARNDNAARVVVTPAPAAGAALAAQDQDSPLTIATWVDPDEMDAFMPRALETLNEMTPRIVLATAR
jgi:hypothetical protein